jgi:hypothetical protein
MKLKKGIKKGKWVNKKFWKQAEYNYLFWEYKDKLFCQNFIIKQQTFPEDACEMKDESH